MLNGVMHMRTHVEVDPTVGLKGYEAIERLAKDYAWGIDLQLCAFLQEGWTNVAGRRGERREGAEARRDGRRRRAALRRERQGADRAHLRAREGLRRGRRHPPRRRLHDARHGHLAGVRSHRPHGLGRARRDRARQQVRVLPRGGARSARASASPTPASRWRCCRRRTSSPPAAISSTASSAASPTRTRWWRRARTAPSRPTTC